MRLYLNGGEEELVARALRKSLENGDEDTERVLKILDRIETCKELQKPHTRLMRLDGNQPKH